MNFRFQVLIAPLTLLAGCAIADEKLPDPPVPVHTTPTPPPPVASENHDYEQRVYAPSGVLISPDKAKQIVDTFRDTYGRLGRPRVLIYVNRELVDEHSGLKLTGRTESTKSTVKEKESSFQGDAPRNPPSPGTSSDTTNTPGKGSSTSKSTTVTSNNSYSSADKPAPTLADRQTVREIERLIGRPFRAAGATLADQKVAASLIADQPLDHFVAPTNDTARKDREALTKVADLVIEVLISSRNVTVPQVSGDQTVNVPDIQITAIKLATSEVLGQASASDVLGKDQQAGRIARHFDVRDVTEATALALMDDISGSTK